MTDNRTTELPRMQLHRLLEKHDVDCRCVQQTTFWNSESGSEFLAYQYQVDGVYKLAFKGVNVTPEQAIAATVGNGTLTAEQVTMAVAKHSGVFGRIESGYCAEQINFQAIADELNAELGSGTCELDYDHHCSNCGVCVHERAVLVRKKLDGGLWTVVSKPASFCPNCGRRVKR